MSNRILLDRNTHVPMRDGMVLKADVFRPDNPEPLPAILVRTPYNKDAILTRIEMNPIRFAEAGFAVVYQDTRGRFQSEGTFCPFLNERQDGYDSVEWVARQPWCNGAVGMMGASYLGATQWLAAIEQPPHLRAIFPIVTPSEYYENWAYRGGAFQLGFALLWTLKSLAPNIATRLAQAGQADPAEARRLLMATDHMDQHYRHLPLSILPLLEGSAAADYYFDWITHETDDDYWQAVAVNRHYDRVQVPAFNVGGWYDLFLPGTLENYVKMRQAGGSPVARQGQRLLVGPWSHGNWTGGWPDHDFGVLASDVMADLAALELAFFDHHLKGQENGFAEQMPVRIFVMGENVWRDEPAWPLDRTRYTPWYLHSEGAAGTDGAILSPQPPGQEPQDVYLFDPRNPVPTVGGPSYLPGLLLGANSGPKDQTAVEARMDVLVYTSAPLEQPLEVTGPLTMHLYAASSAPDTDFVVRLCDVYPDGASRILAEGILRARFREGYERPRPIEPDEVYAYQIDLGSTSNLFRAGHRIRVDVTSSSFPRFDHNANTGHPLGQDGPEDLQPAKQTVFHDAAHPSRIVLPITPR